ncbi:MAG TPA: ComEC/Rec2 family competence protein [Candidatus Paceibacterota bacterium]
MAIKLIPFFLLSFLGGVGLRSFFDISLNFSWVAFGAIVGFGAIRHLFQRSFRSPEKLGLSRSESFQDENADNRPPQERTNYRFDEVNVLLLVTTLFFLGVIRLSYFEKNIEQDNLHNFYGQEISVEGNVLESKFTQASQRVIVKTNEGKALLVTRVFPKYKYGDILKINGEVSEPKGFGDIDMKKILAKDKIFSEVIFPKIERIGFKPESKILNFLFGVREKFEEKLKLILPEPQASLANGMLLGNEGVLEENIKTAFQKSGTIHILVLSGYNITVIGMAMANLLGFIPAVVSIILFVLMTGAEAPAVRAAIMGIIGLIVVSAGRLKTAMLALFWSAFFMIMWNPAVLRFDRGFQLSFLATLGLIVLSRFFTKKFKFLPKFLSIRESAASTFSAQIFVLPLLLSWGNYVSFLSPVANILIVGAVPYVMAFSFFGGLAAFLFVPLGQAVASVSHILISYQIYVAKIFSIF